MTETIVIGETEFPVHDSMNSRPFTRVKGLSEGSPYTIFSENYHGPFTAVQDDLADMPRPFGLQKVETATGKKNSYIVFEDAHHPGGKVIDRDGKVVATADTWIAAYMIAITLNKQPKSITDGMLVGLTPSHGLSRRTSDDKFAFWCIQVQYVDIATKDKRSKSFVCPFYERYEPPQLTKSPISALRFSGHSEAMSVINLIMNEILPLPEVQKLIEDRRARAIAGSMEPDWSTMHPVMVKYAYNVIKYGHVSVG